LPTYATFTIIDKVHQRPEGTAARNFRHNRAYFFEKEDYFSLSHQEVKSLDEFRLAGIKPNSQGLTVLTASGYLMLVKSLTDKLAWQVQRILIKTYFQFRSMVQPASVGDFPLAISLKERVTLIELKHKLSLDLGKAPVETHALLKKSLYEICVRLGEVVPNTMLSEPLSWVDLINLPDGGVPFDS